MSATDSLLALEPEKLTAPNSKALAEENKWWGVTKAVLLRLLTMVLSIALILVVWQLFLEIFGIDPFIGAGRSTSGTTSPPGRSAPTPDSSSGTRRSPR